MMYKGIEDVPRYQKKTGPQQLYGLSRREKQKLKAYYGNLSENVFRNAIKQAYTQKQSTPFRFLQIMELRLDCTLYRCGLVQSAYEARQWVKNGMVLVNGSKASSPSRSLDVGDVVIVHHKIYKTALRNIKQLDVTYREERPYLSWRQSLDEGGFLTNQSFLTHLEVNVKALAIKVVKLPDALELRTLQQSVLALRSEEVEIDLVRACSHR